MSRRRFLDRTHRNREQRAQDGRGFYPAGMFRLAGFGAALLIFVAVYIGFVREDGPNVDAERVSVLERLVQPVFFGVNTLEILAVLIAGLIALRIWRRME